MSVTATYVTYIVAPRVKVWKALTDGTITPKYFFGRRIESGWKQGDEWKMYMENPLVDGEEIVDSEGVVLEVLPGRKLVKSWRVVWLPEFKTFPEGRVSYTLDEMGFGVTRLTMEQSHDGVVPAHYVEMGRKGWAAILSGLKTLLETGSPFPPIDMSK